MTDVPELDEIEDKRTKVLADFLIKMTKLKPDKFMKPYGLEETKRIYRNFFDDKTQRILFVAVSK
jgi:hypothetical protein